MNQKYITLGASFRFAFKGLKYFFKTERNGKIQLVGSLAVIILSFVFRISPVEWLFVALAISLIIVSEMLNTAVEKVCDLITTDYNPQIKVIKDISAGAVLFAFLFSIVTGLIIFVPKLF